MPVSARFHGIRDKVLSVVDDKFAEPVIIHPMVGKSKLDPSRPIIEIEAVLRGGEGSAASIAGGRSAGWESRVVAGKAQLHIDRSAYPSIVIKPGDKVRAVSRHGEPWFEVSDVDDRGYSRLVLNLTETN